MEELALTAPPRPVRPRVWPTFLVLVAALPAIVVVAGVSVLVVATLTGGFSQEHPRRGLEGWLEKALESPARLVPVVLAVELTMLAVAVGAALLSQQPLIDRLGLRRPAAGAGTIVLCLLGTLGVQFAITTIADALIEELSPNLELLADIVLDPSGLSAVLVIAALSVAPGICEEMLCRGYAQTRFVAAWGGWRGLIVPTVYFALLHFDPQHTLFVLPLGAWFGFVAWRTGSTWTAILCHVVNNAAAFGLARALGRDEEITGGAQTALTIATVLCLACSALAVRALMRTRPRAEVAAAPAVG